MRNLSRRLAVAGMIALIAWYGWQAYDLFNRRIADEINRAAVRR